MHLRTGTHSHADRQVINGGKLRPSRYMLTDSALLSEVKHFLCILPSLSSAPFLSLISLPHNQTLTRRMEVPPSKRMLPVHALLTAEVKHFLCILPSLTLIFLLQAQTLTRHQEVPPSKHMLFMHALLTAELNYICLSTLSFFLPFSNTGLSLTPTQFEWKQKGVAFHMCAPSFHSSHCQDNCFPRSPPPAILLHPVFH